MFRAAIVLVLFAASLVWLLGLIPERSEGPAATQLEFKATEQVQASDPLRGGPRSSARRRATSADEVSADVDFVNGDIPKPGVASGQLSDPVIIGRVLDELDRPVAGGSIYVADRIASTDDHGRFTVDCTGSLFKGGGKQDEKQGGVLLLAEHVRHGRAELELPFSACTTGHDTGDLHLAEAAVLTGVVVDDTGPVAGLILEADPLPEDDLVEYAQQRTHTDRNGRFAFRNLSHVAYELNSSSSAVFGPFTPNRRDLTLQLEGGAGYTVRVYDHVGNFLPNVQPEVQRVIETESGEWDYPRAWSHRHTLHQHEDGTWNIAFRAPGPRVLIAELSRLDGILRAEVLVEVVPGAREHVDLRMRDVVTLEVRDLITLAPDHSRVDCSLRAWNPATGALTMRDGRVSLPSVLEIAPNPPSLALSERLNLDPRSLDRGQWVSPGWGGRVQVSFDVSEEADHSWVQLRVLGQETLWMREGSQFCSRSGPTKRPNVSHPALPAGEYELSVRAAWGASSQMPFKVETGKIAELSLQLP